LKVKGIKEARCRRRKREHANKRDGKGNREKRNEPTKRIRKGKTTDED
jgi:hypothetical protein